MIDALVRGFLDTLAYVFATLFMGWLFLPAEVL